MTKKLQSLLEMAVVVGGLAGTPVVVLSSLGTIIAAVQTERAGVTMVQESPSLVLRTAGLKF